MFSLFRFLLKLYADCGYQGPQFRNVLKRVCNQVSVEIVKRSDTGKFVALPKRWIVVRSIAWLNRCRQQAKDLCQSSRALQAVGKALAGKPQSNRVQEYVTNCYSAESMPIPDSWDEKW